MDKGHKNSTKIVTAVEAGQLNAVTSTLTLIEIASAVKRASRKFAHATDSDDEIIHGSFIRRTLHLQNLQYIGLGSEISLNQESRVRIPTVYALAMKAVSNLTFRTLDQ